MQTEYTMLKHKNFYLDILKQLLKFSQSKEPMSESESDFDNEMRTPPINIYTMEIERLIERIKHTPLDPPYVEDKICEISKKLDLSLKHHVLFQKKQEVSEKTDKAYKEKYAFRIFKEVQK